MKLKVKELAAFISLIVAGLSITFYIFVYSTQQSKIEALKIEYDSNNNKLQKLMDVEKSTPEQIKRLGEINLKLNSINRRLTNKKDVPGILVQLYELINDNSLKSDIVNFGGIIQNEKYNSFGLNFRITGDSTEIESFLNDVENLKSEISIERISFQPLENKEFNVSLNLKVYLSKDETTENTNQDYDFMDGNYGSNRDWLEIFKAK